MTGMVEQRSKLRFATKLLPNCFWGVRYVVEIIGGPDRDRTDDLFHAMEARSQLRHRPTLRKDSIYSGGQAGISQRCRELICYVVVSKDNRVKRALGRRRRCFDVPGASQALYLQH
jgi:hypothetical protein